MSAIDLQSIDQARHLAQFSECPGCGRRNTLAAHAVRKEGPNTGRLFMTCGSCGKFVWLSGGPSRPKPVAETVAPTQAESEEAGLIDDITSHPDDDAPRLIYADWLEDRGEVTRAEFVRLGLADDPRANVLLERYGSFWFGPLEEVAERWHLARGFVESATLTAAAFAAHAERLTRSAPAAEWHITFTSWGELKGFTSSPGFARVRRLRLDGCPLGGDGVRIVTACPRAVGLRSLSLTHHGLGVPGVQSLTMSAHLRELRHLDLSANNLTPTAVAVLASSASVPNLTRLSLAGNEIDDAGVRALVNSRHLKSLRELDLSGNALTPEGADAPAGSALMRRLTRLDVANCGLGTSGTYRLRQAANGIPGLGLTTSLPF